MSYLVRVYQGPDDMAGLTIHSPYQDTLKLTKGELDLKTSGIDEFDFALNVDNPAYGLIQPYRTLITVKDVRTHQVVFNGRVYTPTGAMDVSGIFNQTFKAESKLAYLHDSRQRWGEYHNITAENLLKVMLDRHNATMPHYKQFKLGRVTVTDSNDSLYRYLGYEDTYDTIKDKLTDRLGGYLAVREEDDGTYLDYLAEIGEHHKTPIAIQMNMQSAERTQDMSVVTRLVPLGATIDSTKTGDTQASKPQLTIASVNDGKDYLDDPDLEALVGGVVEDTVEWSDVKTATALKAKGQAWLKAQKPLTDGLSLTVLDRSFEPENQMYEPLIQGDYYPFRNKYLAPDQEIQISELKVDIMQPYKPTISIGSKPKRISSMQVDAQNIQQLITNLQQNIVSGSATLATIQAQQDAAEKVLADITKQTIAQAAIPTVKLSTVKAGQITYTITPSALPDDSTVESYQAQVSSDQNEWTPGSEISVNSGTFTVSGSTEYWVQARVKIDGYWSPYGGRARILL